MYRHSGIGRYLRNLFPLLLPKLEARRVRVLGSKDLFGEALWLGDTRVEVVEETAPIYSAREQTMRWRGRFSATDLLWIPHYNAPLWAGVRTVVTVHDIAPVAIPTILNSAVKRMYARLLIERAVRQAEAILSVSEFTARELETRLGVRREKITVTPPGLEIGWPESVRPHVEGDGVPYVLFVGNVKPNKNLQLLLRAFRRVMGTVPHRVVIVGRTEGLGTTDSAVMREAMGYGDRVRFAGGVSDDELVRLYAGASAFCLPSLYEGFGLPLLEAMASGCPVLCSEAGSLPEVAGDAAMYFDASDEAGLAECLVQVSDQEAMDRLRRLGRERVKLFRFEDCATRSAEVMNRLLGMS